MYGESNFMHYVMVNGVGGINAGGIENDVNPWKHSNDVIDEINTFRYLTRDPKMADMYCKMGCLKLVNNKGSLSHKYRITQMGKETYSGSDVVNTWLERKKRILKLREKYKSIRNKLNDEQKEHLLNEINNLEKEC